MSLKDIIGGRYLITSSKFIVRLEADDGTLYDTCTIPRDSSNDPAAITYPHTLHPLRNIRVDTDQNSYVADTDQYTDLEIANL